MTYRSDNVERMSDRPPIAAEVIALQRTSESCQFPTHAAQHIVALFDYVGGASTVAGTFELMRRVDNNYERSAAWRVRATLVHPVYSCHIRRGGCTALVAAAAGGRATFGDDLLHGSV
jgi:hypothetical protein